MNYLTIFNGKFHEIETMTVDRLEDMSTVACCAGLDAPKRMREFIESKNDIDTRMIGIYKKLLLADAQNDFDCFCRYLEFDNPKGFYPPRRWYLLPVVKDLQDLHDNVLDVLIIRLISRSGKSTLTSLFNLWIGGERPNGSILAAGANDTIADTLYHKFLNFYNKYENQFLEIYPKATLKKQSLEKYGIWLGRKGNEYPTFKSMSVDTGREGATEAKTLRYLDDTVQSQDSQEAIDKKWNRGIMPQVLGRITGKVPVLSVGTARGINDHQQYLENWAKEKKYRFKIASIPALNSNDESNYACVVWDEDGTEKSQFSTEELRGERAVRQGNAILRAQWQSEFMCNPIPVEGFMFPELLRGDPPDREPDVVIARADTAADGTDSTNMQICKGYLNGSEIKGYITKIMHDDSGSKITVPKMVNMIIENDIKEITIESNTGGAVFADTVEYMLNQQGYLCKIIKKHQNSNKHGRISGASGFILENIYFKKAEDYTLSSDYGKAVTEIMEYTATGLGVKHDDAPDVTAAIAEDLMIWLMSAAKKTPTKVSDRWF